MWPFGHLAVGYLCYVIFRSLRARLPAQRGTLLTLAVATQLPDLIDKPLAYWDILPSGRSLGHSALVFVLVIAVVEIARHRQNQKRPSNLRSYRRSSWYVAGLTGYASHLLADSYRGLFAGDIYGVRYLWWPISPAMGYSGDEVPPWTRLLTLEITQRVRLQLALLAIALTVFLGLRIRANGWPHPLRRFRSE